MATFVNNVGLRAMYVHNVGLWAMGYVCALGIACVSRWSALGLSMHGASNSHTCAHLPQSIDDGGDRGQRNRVAWGHGRLLEGLRDIALLLLLTRQPAAEEVHMAIRVNVRQAAAIWHLDDPVAVRLLLICACCVKPRDIGGTWCSPQARAQQTSLRSLSRAVTNKAPKNRCISSQCMKECSCRYCRTGVLIPQSASWTL